MTLLAVDDITVRYGRLTALRGVTLKVAEGEILFVTGPNGAGKSTLLNAIAGVAPPVAALSPWMAQRSQSPAEMIARHGFSLVPEGRNVFRALTVEENLKVGAGMRADRHKSPTISNPSIVNSRCWPSAATPQPACFRVASSRCSSSAGP